MPPKRRRIDSDGEEEATAAEVPVESKSLPHHPEIWFDDGSIVLASNAHLYRVHKGMLAKHSSVLKDMFDMPSEDANMERLDDVPIVKMVGDSDAEVHILLKAIYNRNFRDTFGETPPLTIISLLSIASKYDFTEIQADITKFIESIFPDSYEVFTKGKLNKWLTLSVMVRLLEVAQQCNILSVQPVLAYFLCTFSLPLVRRCIPALSMDCFMRLLQMREWLIGRGYALMMDALQLGERNETLCSNLSCMECIRDQLGKKRGLKPGECPTFILTLTDLGILHGMDIKNSDICQFYAFRYATLVKERKKEAWEALPKLFLEKTWEELKPAT